MGQEEVNAKAKRLNQEAGRPAFHKEYGNKQTMPGDWRKNWDKTMHQVETILGMGCRLGGKFFIVCIQEPGKDTDNCKWERGVVKNTIEESRWPKKPLILHLSIKDLYLKKFGFQRARLSAA